MASIVQQWGPVKCFQFGILSDENTAMHVQCVHTLGNAGDDGEASVSCDPGHEPRLWCCGETL